MGRRCPRPLQLPLHCVAQSDAAWPHPRRLPPTRKGSTSIGQPGEGTQPLLSTRGRRQLRREAGAGRMTNPLPRTLHWHHVGSPLMDGGRHLLLTGGYLPGPVLLVQPVAWVGGHWGRLMRSEGGSSAGGRTSRLKGSREGVQARGYWLCRPLQPRLRRWHALQRTSPPRRWHALQRTSPPRRWHALQRTSPPRRWLALQRTSPLLRWHGRGR